MENTVKVLFEDDQTPKWYVALGDQWNGPLTAADVYEKVLSQEISWAHFVWKPGQVDWQRICDVPTFKAAVPILPGKGITKEVKDAASPTVKKSAGRRTAAPPPAPKKKTAEVRTWFLYYNDSQFGPFSPEEIDRFLRVGKIHGRVFGWKEGMPNWERLEGIALFGSGVVEAKKVRAKEKSAREKTGSTKAEKVEQRKAPRRPLVARIFLANDAAVIVAVCRDISVGGMQILTDRVPGSMGARLRMNVSPSSESKGNRIQPFVAEGVIVRILEDGRGFSFRFEKLPEESKRAIESYIATAE